jgi:hypothetical protein
MDLTLLLDGAIAAAAVAAGSWAGVRGTRLLVRGIRSSAEPEAPLRVIRGLRGIIVAICAAAAAAGLLLEARWLLIVGGLWLAEEIYETGVLALILRAGAASAPPATPHTTHTGGTA